MNVLFLANAWHEFNEIKENSILGKSIRATSESSVRLI